MRSSLPQSLRDHMEFSEAFDELGRRLFPHDWNGREVGFRDWEVVLPPEEANELCREAEQKRRILGEKGHCCDNEHIRAVIAQNEYTGDFDQARLADDPYDHYSWPKLVARLHFIIEYFDGKPSSDSPEYAELYDAFARGKATLAAMLSLLADGKIQAFHKGSHGRQLIEANLWGARTLNVDAADSAMRLPDARRRMEGISVKRAELQKVLQSIPSSGGISGKHAAANAAEAELIRMMSDTTQRRTRRTDVFADFKDRWPDLTERDFNLCWKVACARTKSGWNKPGRTRSQELIAAQN